MAAVWLLTTCWRPSGCQDTLDACEQTGMTSPGVVWVDKHPGAHRYRNLRLPDNWTLEYAPEWGSIAGGMRWVLGRHPNLDQYGWLSDDVRPRTEGWDTKLEQAAGRTGTSCARDLWLSEDEGSRAALISGWDFSSGLCWAGDLIRAVGWWALPGTRQAGIDTAWTAIVGRLRRATYLHDVIVEHHNWRTGRRQQDRADSWVHDGVNYVEEDCRLRDAWISSQDYIDTLDRVSQLNPL